MRTPGGERRKRSVGAYLVLERLRGQGRHVAGVQTVPQILKGIALLSVGAEHVDTPRWLP